jgi:hypothetical protein
MPARRYSVWAMCGLNDRAADFVCRTPYGRGLGCRRWAWRPPIVLPGGFVLGVYPHQGLKSQATIVGSAEPGRRRIFPARGGSRLAMPARGDWLYRARGKVQNLRHLRNLWIGLSIHTFRSVRMELWTVGCTFVSAPLPELNQRARFCASCRTRRPLPHGRGSVWATPIRARRFSIRRLGATSPQPRCIRTCVASSCLA